MKYVFFPLLAFLGVSVGAAFAQEVDAPTDAPAAAKPSSDAAVSEAATDPESDPQAEAIVRQLRPSLVTIRVKGRDGQQRGLGSGFIVDAEGLIATNLHVISEGRRFSVETADGQSLKVLAVEASDSTHDLALVRVQPQDTKLVPLQLAAADSIAQGARVMALGNPLGLEYSVVQGIVSAIRDVDDRQMIQVAMPIEFGNSGGPLVDAKGQVHGIINMKSAIQERIGFAIPIARLHELRARPNPVVIDRWARLGRLDEKRWTPQAGADWQRSSGMIQVRGSGGGIGGRSLCVSSLPVPAKPFEISVSVRLHDETGAAGLIFHRDAKDRHYGFYPSNGRLRLSCFLGPSVFSWQVLAEVDSPDFLPGQWNRLKVRIDDQGIKCYVNGKLAIESNDTQLTGGSTGLATFRSTSADFRQFRVGDISEDDQLAGPAQEWFAATASDPQKLDAVSQSELEMLADSRDASVLELARRAIQLQRQAKQMQKLAEDVRRVPVLRALGDLLTEEDEDDLLRGALLVASLDNPDLDIQAYLDRIDQMAGEIREGIAEDADPAARLKQLDRYLFEENGFHGGRDEYYHPANSHLNRVIDDREGLPITMAILYIELGRRLGLEIEGVGLPGHFVVRHIDGESEGQLIDVFERGERMSRADAARIVLQFSGRLLQDHDLRPQTTEDILIRVLRNLMGSAGRLRDSEAVLRYIDALVALRPEEGEYRMMRAAARHQTDRDHAALEDLQWLIQNQPPGIDIHEVQEMRDFLLK
ncbi:Putative serine protease HhoA precursor [Rosistilla carotiformis]|uniref:Serine protease HhoA n=1 Tax=Rosistilla carotiformis TaxID=2528017 RepID=A0A518JLG3_9BACT|nr:transglutaminase family protein [Rosistilla carotiformis]QDV66382.1 Putative serine protease HhoA precursor [Rosistilla carotiformis]